MAGPFWVDELGQRVPTRRCSQPGCDREFPLHRDRPDTLRLIGWPLYRVASFINWCGHRQEVIPIPDEDEWVCCVPVIGEAK